MEHGDVDLSEFVEGDFVSYCQRMAKPGEWADHVAVVTTARMLQRDIHIVTSLQSADPDEGLSWIAGKEGYTEPPLLLGHVHDLHYESLQPKGMCCTKVPRYDNSLPT